MYVHMYLIDGILFDTGIPHMKKEAEEALRDHLFSKIVVTHHHEDHSGNINALSNTKGVQAWASPKCAKILQNPPRVSPAQMLTWGQNKKTDLQPLDLHNVLESDRYKFEIIETPGHAVDHICLYEKNKGWLVSGDIYVNDYIKIFMSEESILQQIDSINKLLTLDFDVLLCGHNPQFEGASLRLKAKKNFLEDFYDRVKAEFLKGKNEAEIMESLKLKENQWIKTLSIGRLSQVNMIRSVIRDYKTLETMPVS